MASSLNTIKDDIQTLFYLIQFLRGKAVSLAVTPPADVTKSPAITGVSVSAARADHKHDVTTAVPVTITTANAEGSAASLARSDHAHDHGSLAGGALHAVATALQAGFMSAAAFVKLATIQVGATPGLFTWGNNSIAASTTDRYLEVGFSDTIATTAPIQFRMPISGVISNLYIKHNTPNGNGNTIVYTVEVNGVPSALSVAMASTDADGSNLTDSVAIIAGDLVDIIVTKAAVIGASPNDVVASLQVRAV